MIRTAIAGRDDSSACVVSRSAHAQHVPSARLASRTPRFRARFTDYEDAPLAAFQEMPRQRHVVVDRINHVSDPHMLLVGVGNQHGTRAE